MWLRCNRHDIFGVAELRIRIIDQIGTTDKRSQFKSVDQVKRRARFGAVSAFELAAPGALHGFRPQQPGTVDNIHGFDRPIASKHKLQIDFARNPSRERSRWINDRGQRPDHQVGLRSVIAHRALALHRTGDAQYEQYSRPSHAREYSPVSALPVLPFLPPPPAPTGQNQRGRQSPAPPFPSSLFHFLTVSMSTAPRLIPSPAPLAPHSAPAAASDSDPHAADP